MHRISRWRPSGSTAIAFVALFVALIGGAVALPGTNTVDSGDIKNNTIISKDIKDRTIQVKDISVVARNALKGQKGQKGDKGDRGAAGTSIFTSSIPSGRTVAGAWGGRYIAPQLALNNSYLISSSFPVKAPAGLSDTQVNAAPNAAAGDPDATCTGSSDNPTAPAGKVCIYISRANNAQVTGFRLTNPGVAGTSPGDAYGFIVRILDTGTVGNTATTNAEGTWAYTAP
jgi:hypothetical protein